MRIPPTHSCSFCKRLVIDLRKSYSAFDHTTIPGHRVESNLHLYHYHFLSCRLYHALTGYLLGCPLMRHIFSGWKNDVFAALDTDDDYSLCLSADLVTLGSEEMNLQTISSFCVWDLNKQRRLDLSSRIYRKFQVWAAEGNPASEHVRLGRPYQNQGPGYLPNFIKSCLNHEGEHSRCEEPDTEPFVPGRLLRIKKSGDGTFITHITSPGGFSPYAALSYCWGGDQEHKTTKLRILEAPEPFIAWQRLPKTIQDAIIVTEELGIEFLWVDSLCIVQDDEEDKMRELPKMPRIYRAATVTIAAARASSAEEGFLPRVSVDLAKYIYQIPFVTSTGDFGSVHLVDSVLLEGRAEAAEPIDSRAWTLQEGVISKRVVRFERGKVVMTCQFDLGDRRVRVVDGWDMASKVLPNVQKRYYAIKARGARTDPGALESVTKKWADLVDDYTNRHLMLKADRCVAIAGLAQEFHDITGSQYLAGHWRHTLPSSLLWVSHSSQLSRGRCPTWSWTSVDTKVAFPPTSRSVPGQLEIADVDIQLASKPFLFGPVKHGRVMVRGRLLQCRWAPRGLHLLTAGTGSSLLCHKLCTWAYKSDYTDFEFDQHNNSSHDNSGHWEKENKWKESILRTVITILQLEARLPRQVPPPTSATISRAWAEQGHRSKDHVERASVPVALLEIFPPNADKLDGSQGLVLVPTSKDYTEEVPEYRRVGVFSFQGGYGETRNRTNERTDEAENIRGIDGNVVQLLTSARLQMVVAKLLASMPSAEIQDYTKFSELRQGVEKRISIAKQILALFCQKPPEVAEESWNAMLENQRHCFDSVLREELWIV